MRSLILADRAFVMRERALLSRLSMGLADDGVRVSAALPLSLIERAQNDFPVGPLIGYEDSGVFLSRSPRVTRFMERLRSLDRDKTQFDIVHAFGGAAWNFALDLGRRLDALTVLEVWRPGLADRARSLRSGTQRVSFFAPSPGIERLLLKEGAGLTVRLTQWGVWATKSPNPVMREHRSPSMVLIASGRDSSAVTVAFLGACAVLRTNPEIMLFVDADAARRSPVWKLARQENLVDRVSIIDSVEERRDLVIRCDLLLYPEARGEQRSVIYDAMGAGMAVIAAADPMNPALIPNVTARVLTNPDTEMWTTEIRRLVDQPDLAREIGRSARDRIRNDFRATAHIRSVLEAYEWLSSSRPITATAVR